MSRGDCKLTCCSCRYMRRWPEKGEWLRRVYGPVRCDAFLCMHPERRNPVRVDVNDEPCNGSSTKGAQSCPMKLRETKVGA